MGGVLRRVGGLMGAAEGGAAQNLKTGTDEEAPKWG